MYQADGTFESEDGTSTWFIRGNPGKQVKIEVVRSRLAEYVQMNVEWLNLSSPPEIKRGRITISISTSNPRELIQADTLRAVERCLNIYKDVLQGVGVAGKAALVEKTFAEVDMPVDDGGNSS